MVAGALVSENALAQSLKLGVQGITIEEDTLAKENIVAHSVISIKSGGGGKKDRTLTIGGMSRSSIRIFEFGWNMVDVAPGGEWFALNNWRSNQVTINPFIFSATNNEGNLGLSIAFGFRANNYMFDGPFTIVKDNGIVEYAPLPYDIKKSKFTTAALHVPMELTFGKPSRVAFSIGGFADLVYSSHTKIKYRNNGKDKVWHYPVNFLQPGFTAKFTIRKIAVFCNYTPDGLFKSGKGPAMGVWSFGIGL